ncbi:MAG: S9 family peptidase [Pseudomonadota bacterium]|nr:S9 family peptidase [Pseudomonadota bacterium]
MKRQFRHRTMWLACMLGMVLGSSVSMTGYAQTGERPSMTGLVQSLATVTNYQEVSVSPDRHLLAWVQTPATMPAPANGSPTDPAIPAGSAIFIQPTDQSAPPRLVTAKPSGGTGMSSATENAIAWSRDGGSLAFLSDADSAGQMQLYVARTTDHTVRRLTQLAGTLATPRWSPDGKRIAILFTEHANRSLGPLAAVPAPVGVIDAQIFEQGLWIVDAASGAGKRLSAPDRYIYEYDWSPDGRQIVATGAHGSGDNNWYVAELLELDVPAGTEHVLLKPSMQMAAPRWSPDGRSIAFLGGLMSDESIAAGDIYEIPSAGGLARNLTPGLRGSAFSLIWRNNSADIVFAEAIDGGSGIAEYHRKGNSVVTLWQGPQTLRATRDLAFGLSLAADGKTSAVIRESFEEPPSIWAGEVGRWKRVTPVPGQRSRWGQAQSVRWTSDEFSVQGWLIPPPHLDPARKYPMVVWVHGGPAWLTASSWPASLDSNLGPFLASQDYFVFFPNPRGSTGFGERFTAANVKDISDGPLRDILAGIRKVVATHPVDDSRVGITGWSYGGYMTMWALTQTSRFRAAVAGAGVANWLSYYGENGIDEGLIPYFGASVYDVPDLYAKSSPINFIKNVRTPTLIVVGDSDVECPAPQSYEYWHALKSLHVKTELIVYPHEGHEFSDPAHVADFMQRMVTWFDEHMPQT